MSEQAVVKQDLGNKASTHHLQCAIPCFRTLGKDVAQQVCTENMCTVKVALADTIIVVNV